MTITCLGDQAALAYLADETAALQLAARVRRSKELWLVDVVQAYTTVAVYFDLEQMRFAEVAAWLSAQAQASCREETDRIGQRHDIPCCYELGRPGADCRAHPANRR